jgi:acetylornithine deacetylase
VDLPYPDRVNTALTAVSGSGSGPGPAPVVAPSTDEVRVLDLVDEGSLVDSLIEVMSIPSVGGSDAEVEIQHRLADRLTETGLDTDLWPFDLDALTGDPGFPGVEVTRREAWGLVAASRSDEVPALVLQGHVDVVPAGDRTAWATDPFSPVALGDSIVGRGSCDMKAGVVAVLAAAQAVQRSGVALARGFAVHFGVGEEDGGLGAFGTLARGHVGDACIIPEPTGLRLVTANAGALTFRIEVPGLATHGSTSYAGSSAIDSYLAIHLALAELQIRRNRDPEPLLAHLPIPYPLSVGRLRSGDWPSSVPDLLVAEGRYGLRIEEDPVLARLELEEAVATAAQRDPYLRNHPPVVSWPGGQFRGGHLPAGDDLRRLVGQAHTSVTGVPLVGEFGVPYGSDLRLYAGAGVPTLHYGPGDLRLAHGPNESVPVAEVAATARVLALAILRACR